MHKWLEKFVIAHPNHIQDLERSAAVYQYHGGLSKEGSEIAAYQDYRKMQLMKAAAYHFDGMELSKKEEDESSYRKHLGMYALLCQELGVKHSDKILPGVKAHSGTFGEVKDFKPYEADILVLNKV